MQQRRGARGVRANALWGRGGRRTGAAVAICVIAASLAATATAGTSGRHGFWGFNVKGIGRTCAYIPDSLASAIQQNPRQRFDVIVEGVQKPQDSSQTRVSPTGLRSGMLGIRQGANTIGTSQIGGLYQSINGLHAGLTGQQIKFLARLPYVAAIVPNDAVQMSSWGGSNNALYSNAQRWAWTVGARANWGWSCVTGERPDDRRRRLRRRRERGRLRRPPARPGQPHEPDAELAGRRLRPRHVRRRHRSRRCDGLRRCHADREPVLRRRHERRGPGDRRRRHRRLRLDPPEQGAVQHPHRQLLAPRRRAREPLLRPARPGGREAVAQRRHRRGCRGELRDRRPGERRAVRAGQRSVRDHRRRGRHRDDDLDLGRRRRAVVGMGLHAGRLLEARPLRSRPLPGRAGLGEQRARARAAGSRRRARLHAAERDVVLGADGRRRGGDAARAASRLDAGPGQGRADDVRERDARGGAAVARHR